IFMYVRSTKEVVATMILSNDGCFGDDGATTENTLRSKRKISKGRLGGVLGQFVCKRTKEVYMVHIVLLMLVSKLEIGLFVNCGSISCGLRSLLACPNVFIYAMGLCLFTLAARFWLSFLFQPASQILDYSIMKTLLSLAICPILKDLYVHRNRHEDDNVKKFTVKVPSLETLECVKEGLIVLNEEGVEDFGGYFMFPKTLSQVRTTTSVRSKPDDKLMRSLSSLKYLEIFEWKEYSRTAGEKKVVRNILANSKNLESMPRISTSSQLLFSTQLEYV
ncbi:LOW QUALITY PROTEIN: hypothetical protein HID58_084865, partial [Brassica napus]